MGISISGLVVQFILTLKSRISQLNSLLYFISHTGDQFVFLGTRQVYTLPSFDHYPCHGLSDGLEIDGNDEIISTIDVAFVAQTEFFPALTRKIERLVIGIGSKWWIRRSGKWQRIGDSRANR